MEVPKPAYIDFSRFSATVSGSVFGLLLGCGFGLSLLLSTLHCAKQDMSASFSEGLSWALYPTIVYIILQISPWFLSIFTEGVSSLLGYFKYSADSSAYETMAIVYALILVGLIVTTRLVHKIEVAVCKPNTQELSNFKENLLKQLKEKEEAAAANNPTA